MEEPDECLMCCTTLRGYDDDLRKRPMAHEIENKSVGIAALGNEGNNFYTVS